MRAIDPEAIDELLSQMEVARSMLNDMNIMVYALEDSLCRLESIFEGLTEASRPTPAVSVQDAQPANPQT